MPLRRLSSARPCLPRPGRARAGGASILVAALRQSGGFLYGSGRITTPDFRWTGGNVPGSGTVEIQAGGAGLAMSGATHTLDQTRTLQIDRGATATWTDGDLELRDASQLDNRGRL